MIRVAVLSDTHGLLRRTVVDRLKGCACILHAGDVISQSDLDELAVYGSLYAVRGNCDMWQRGVSDLAKFLRFQIGGVSFYMTHDPYDIPADLSGVQAVIYGHTHQYREEWKDGRLYLNPGSCGRSRFGGDVTMAFLTLDGGKITGVERVELNDAEY